MSKRAKFVFELQEHYGYEKEKADREIDSLQKSLHLRGSDECEGNVPQFWFDMFHNLTMEKFQSLRSVRWLS